MAQNQKIWEGAIRISHWLMVVLLVALFATAEFRIFPFHFYFGYALLAVIVFRVLWGFVGSHEANFIHGIMELKKLPAYFQKLFTTKPDYTPGHTPAGWAMTFLLIVAMATQLFFGLTMEKEFNGTIYKREWSFLFASHDLKVLFNFLHTEVVAKVIGGLVAVHILAVLWYRKKKKQDLTMGLITGEKMVDKKIKTINFPKLCWRSLFVAIFSLALTYWAIYIFPPSVG